jgi:putative ABC transport system permease protein
MFQNYFRTAWRNLLRNRSYSVVNIPGLTIGMAVALLIGLWVQYQYSYDRWLPGYKQMAQVRMRFVRNGETVQMIGTPLPLTQALRQEVPGIQWAAHTDWMGTHGLVAGEHKIFLIGAQAEEDFCRVFPYQTVKGDVNEALKRPSSIVLTESTCKALFGNEEPMGKKVRVDNQQDFFVDAVIRDLPSNSTFDLRYILPFSYNIQTNDWVREAITNWNQNSFQTFVTIDPHTSYAQVEANMRTIAGKYNPKFVKEGKLEFFLQPMSHWHLYSDFKNGHEDGGFIEYVRLFSTIGVLVLLIACINFMNLSRARSEKRTRAAGILESIFVTSIAAALSLVLVKIALPSFNLLTSCPIRIPWRSTVFWEMMVGYVIITGLLAGSRPVLETGIISSMSGRVPSQRGRRPCNSLFPYIRCRVRQVRGLPV